MDDYEDNNIACMMLFMHKGGYTSGSLLHRLHCIIFSENWIQMVLQNELKKKIHSFQSLTKDLVSTQVIQGNMYLKLSLQLQP